MYAKPTVLNAFCNSSASCCMLFSEKQSLSAGSMQTWPKSMIGIRDSMSWITGMLHYPALWTSHNDGFTSFGSTGVPPTFTGTFVCPQEREPVGCTWCMEIYNVPQNPIESYQFLALCAPIPLLASFLLFFVLALLEVFGILELLDLLEVLHMLKFLCIFFFWGKPRSIKP